RHEACRQAKDTPLRAERRAALSCPCPETRRSSTYRRSEQVQDGAQSLLGAHQSSRLQSELECARCGTSTAKVKLEVRGDDYSDDSRHCDTDAALSAPETVPNFVPT